MNFMLNIGLAVPGDRPMDATCVLPIVANRFAPNFTVVANDVRQSATEPTLILKFEDNKRGVVTQPRTVRRIVFQLARLLRQDCIALRWEDGSGELLGPNAAEWGAFNPAYFITLEPVAA
jgi:hypothetical protein